MLIALCTMIWWSEEKAWDTAGVICTDLKCNFKRANMQIWNNCFVCYEKANINRQSHFHHIVYDSGLGSDEWDESVGLLAREKADEVWCLREAIGPGWHLCFAFPLYTSTLQNTLRGAIGPGWHLQIAIGQALMHEQYLTLLPAPLVLVHILRNGGPDIRRLLGQFQWRK